MKWIVLWKNNGRIGSAELTEENLQALQGEFYLSHLQTDASGTVHYEVLGVRRPRKIKRK